MKTLITHINPHLDDICGIWLLKKFHPEYKNAWVDFISASREATPKAGEAGILSERSEPKDKVFVGTGGGKFDEHKEGLENTCSGSLVFDFLKKEHVLPLDEITLKALEELVEWNLLVDTGKAPVFEFSEFSIQSIIRPKNGSKETSKQAVELGEEILNRLLEVLKNKQQSLKDWETKQEFETKFGKTIAVKSEFVDRAFCKQREGDLFLIYNPKNLSVQFFTPSFEIDLEKIYQKVKQLDPEADWFLHQSHHMVICGSSSAPESKPTKLSFEQLIEIVKNLP